MLPFDNISKRCTKIYRRVRGWTRPEAKLDAVRVMSLFILALTIV